jgi:hypothetical protein
MKKKQKTEEQLFKLDVRYIAKCIRAMREALQDALNVFTEKGQLVTAERREAWERALKMTDGDPRPKLPPGWVWAEVSVPESDMGPDFYDGRALALMDAAKCKATMAACEQFLRERDEARAQMQMVCKALRREGGRIEESSGTIIWQPLPASPPQGSTANAPVLGSGTTRTEQPVVGPEMRRS